jgi:AcrR family transcriptional regulator
VGGLYGRFKSRDDLLTALHSNMLERVTEKVVEELDKPHASPDSLIRAFVRCVIDFIELNGFLLPLVKAPGNLERAVATEMNLRDALKKSLAKFPIQSNHRDPDMMVNMIVHIILASIIRESSTLNQEPGRLLGWTVLREELPVLVLSYLHADHSLTGT